MKKESGQILVPMLIFLPLLLMLLFSVANTTLLVRDRVRLQNGADAAALSSAEWQANGMNRLATANLSLAGIALLKAYVNHSNEPLKQQQARLALLDGEIRFLHSVKSDILTVIPIEAEKAAQRNGLRTLIGKEGGRANSGYGIASAGVSGKWNFDLGPDGSFNMETNRVFGLAWRSKTKKGVLNNIFNLMTLKPAYDLAAAATYSPSYTGGEPLVPDFRTKLAPIILTEPAWRFLKEEHGLYFIHENYEELNAALRH
ncbi:MAG: hypothetical protein A2293_10780 [Elusimicrobia bacterium RIFOXYB2_FULL_49_7]|nr:MAG: hypothetical protein A2293_10780 [Elusimicrobia bacterium RIFOXYB2_FULL_49_7]